MSSQFKSQPEIKFGLGIDWETSGSSWGNDSSIDYQGISFGAIVFNAKTFEPIETLYREIKFNPNKFKWSDDAEKIHGLSREHLEEHGVTQEDAAADLLDLILKYFGPNGKVMFLGHNPEFDRRFTDQCLRSVEFEFSVEHKNKDYQHIQLHHVMLDTSALGFITLGLYKSDLLFEALGFEARKDHNALDDIKMTLETCRTLREIVSIGVESLS